MKFFGLLDLLLFGCFILLIHGITESAASSPLKDPLLGVSPEDENYFKGFSTSSMIKCKDGSKKFNKSQLNDDFCDCSDGSDEPGTSACPNGKFYCKNAGHSPLILYSSRVNDGICDCCDGSDEYDGKTKCLNTCWEAGKTARDKLKKKIATYVEGVTLRRQEIEKAKLAIAKEEGELSKLKDEEKILKPLVEKLKERKEQIEKVEEEERLRIEKEENKKKEAEEAEKKETKAEDIEHAHDDIQDNIGTVDQPPQNYEEEYRKAVNDHSIKDRLPNTEAEGSIEGSLQADEQLEEGSTFSDSTGLHTENQDENIGEDTESLSREELGRRIASRWTGEKTDQHEEVDASSPDKDHQNTDELSNETNYDEEDNAYTSEEDEHKFDDDDDDDSKDQVDDFGTDDHYNPTPSQKLDSDDESDFSDISGTSGSSWLEKIQKTVKTMLDAVKLFQTPVNISDAAHVRKEYDESSAKLSKIQSRISSLTKKLNQDLGPEKEFYSFYGQCFETKQNKYVYKVCPFKQATQVEGYSTTRLGSWEKFEDSYRVMQFLNGDKCWNGPDRSMKVKLRCGLKNELTDVDEPSRCEYMALLATPALCVDSRLKELQDKLDSLNKQLPQLHDEL
ncbi:hypothetical protein ABFS82_14G049100 [Erythranthe guttata]|uniref:glucosidase 2 subunit beta n=1 Tax=Erythranthe guttata TaxID=4155 RepID=UPI00064D8A75|nr:PREDICTED: glucosidase 2 subunit beta [Erythranthe guttata]|eukprot:XP_012843063.1 PREDICTED: glucosidase 2 subunit beta [Erythranthe guttata]